MQIVAFSGVCANTNEKALNRNRTEHNSRLSENRQFIRATIAEAAKTLQSIGESA